MRLLDLILSCATDLTDCQKALIKAACQGVTGFFTGGLAGAAAGAVSGGLGALAACIDWCSLLDLFSFSPSGGGSTGGGGWGGWGGGWGYPTGSGSGGGFSVGGCGSSPSGLAIPSDGGQGVCARVRLPN